MKLGWVDAIVEFTPGQRIVAVKAVTRSEDYLQDHFPTFPVLPGVLMLEVMAEAAGWLVYDARDFAPSVILLREVRNVTYKSFVKPGDRLTVEVTCRRLGRDHSDFSGVGRAGAAEVVKGRFGLAHGAVQDGADQCGNADSARLNAARLRARFASLRPVGAGNGESTRATTE